MGHAMQEEYLNSRSSSMEDSQKGWSNTNSLAVSLTSQRCLKADQLVAKLATTVHNYFARIGSDETYFANARPLYNPTSGICVRQFY